MLKNALIDPSPRRASMSIALVATATIVGALIFEGAGFLPCELCLLQRNAYYVGAPVAFVLAFLNPRWIKPALIAMAALWFFSAGFGVFHSGVEWGWWQGPTTCSGNGGVSDGLPDLTKPAVMCNEAAIRILGLSLAGWNALISFGLAILALRAARPAYGSNSVSQ